MKMHPKCFFILALAFLGASAAPVTSIATVGGTVGPTVSETVITPYHRTDAVLTPCGRSAVRTTAIPVIPYGVSTGAGFLGTTGVFPGIVGNDFTGIGVGVYPGIVAGGLIGNAGTGYQGLSETGVYSGVDGVAGGLGVYPPVNFL